MRYRTFTFVKTAQENTNKSTRYKTIRTGVRSAAAFDAGDRSTTAFDAGDRSTARKTQEEKK